MESSIFRFVLKHSRREQIVLLTFTMLAFPFIYMSLDLPKTIINQAIGGRDFPQRVLGYEFEQIPFLLLLCGKAKESPMKPPSGSVSAVIMETISP